MNKMLPTVIKKSLAA